MIHERIPVKAPNMNDHIEAFHTILEEECYGRNEFLDFKQACEIISQYIDYYNNRCPHGSLGYLTPVAYYESYVNNIITTVAGVA